MRFPEAPATIVRDTLEGGALAASVEEITPAGPLFRTDQFSVLAARVECARWEFSTGKIPWFRFCAVLPGLSPG